jgi:TRAP-type C4-dicarboxylate transport system substrate-binding protein
MRMLGRCFVFAALALVFVMPYSKGRGDQVATLRMATLAPEASGAGQIFRMFDQSVRKRTGDKIKMHLYAGGVAGDERDVLRKIQLGQFEGAAVTSIGLGQVVRSVLVLQMPGLFDNREQVLKVRKELADEFAKQFESAGYELLAWGDVGDRRIFSNKPVLRPNDYKSLRPWVWREDPISAGLMTVIGANGVLLGLPEVFAALQTGMVDTITATAVSALGLQWFRHVTHMSKSTGEPVVGACVVSKKWMDALAPDVREGLREVTKSFGVELQTKVKLEDDKAAETLRKRGMKEFDMMAQRADWEPVLIKLASNMVGKLYSKELFTRVYTVAHGKPPTFLK